MQNTKVRGGRPAGEKMKLGFREKNEKGERKKEENYIKKWGIGNRPARRKLICRGKK